MKTPLFGSKTHPLTDHAYAALATLRDRGPQPAQSFNAGVRDRLTRESLVDRIERPSPFKTHGGKNIPHLQINAAGLAALAARRP